MGLRTVRLNDETLKVLKQACGKQGGLSLLRSSRGAGITGCGGPYQSAFEIYRRLDLGPGGYWLAPSTKSRLSMQRKLQLKHRP
jgi:hypothetical protein